MVSTDLKIISILSKNSKTTLKKISEEIFISKEAINLRIASLIEKEIIYPYTLINFFNIGKYNVYIQIKFEKIDLNELEELIDELIKTKTINWISETFHEYDIAISIVYRNQEHIEKIIHKIKQLSRNNINKIHFLNIKSVHYFGFSPDRLNNQNIYTIDYHNSETIKLNKKEEKIIELISNNGRYKLTEIAKKIDFNPNSVKYLIKNLKNKNVVIEQGLFVNYINLGFNLYKIIIETYITEKEFNQILQLKGIVFLCKTFEERIIIDFIAVKIEDVRIFITKIEKIVNKINSYQIYEVVKIHKLNKTK